MLFQRDFNFEIFLGVNFRGCCISCLFKIEICDHGNDANSFIICKEVWEPMHGQILQCARERSNRFDPFAFSVVNSEEIVGHVLRKISAACALFLQHHGLIRCEVTGDRRYSKDLLQGGLEIPCDLIFEGEKKYIQKIEKLLTNLVTNSQKETVKGVTADTLSETVEGKSGTVEGEVEDFEENERKAK